MLDLHVSLRSGTRLFITGPIGAGKSTLLRVLFQIYTDPQFVRGHLFPYTHHGQPIPIHGHPHHILCLAQETFITHGSLRDQIAYPDLHAHDADIRNALQVLHLEFLEEACGGLDSVLSVQTWKSQLSPGQIQLLAMARVVLRKPKLVVLDEATSAMDHDTANLVFTYLRQTGCTLITVSHDLDLAHHHHLCLRVADTEAHLYSIVS